MSSTITNFPAIIIDQFEKNNHLNWRIVNDGVMGGISKSQFQFIDNNKGLFSGNVSLENNGGFASTRAMLEQELSADLSQIQLKVKGDGQRYSFRIWTTSDFRVSFKLDFDTIEGEWTTHQLDLSDFVPTWRGRILEGIPPIQSKNIQEIGFLISDKQAGKFELLIDWIKIIGD